MYDGSLNLLVASHTDMLYGPTKTSASKSMGVTNWDFWIENFNKIVKQKLSTIVTNIMIADIS